MTRAARRQALGGGLEATLALLLALGVPLIAYAMVALSAPGATGGMALACWSGGALVTALVLRGLGVNAALYLVPTFLTGLSLVLQARLGLTELQGGVILLAFAAFTLSATVLAHGRLAWLARFWWLVYLAMLAVFGVILIWGRRFRGALYLPGLINPADLIKPLMILFAAGYLERAMPKGRATLSSWLTLVALCVLPATLLLIQRDLGLIVLLAGLLPAMAFRHTRAVWLPVAGALLVPAGLVAILTQAAHASRRLAAWRDPFVDETGAGWQLLHGLAALFQGGLWGAGLGEGAPQHIPIAASDFAYAALGEEIGYVGCGLILALLWVFFRAGFRVAGASRDNFSGLTAFGLSLLLALQSLLNIGGVTKSIPLTGMGLPWLSRGGSGLVSACLSAGLLAAAATGKPATSQAPARGGRRRKRPG